VQSHVANDIIARRLSQLVDGETYDLSRETATASRPDIRIVARRDVPAYVIDTMTAFGIRRVMTCELAAT
jgi:hypothetical protein